MKKFLLSLASALCLCTQVSAQFNLTQRGHVAYPYDLSNLWGYTDSASGKEYALVGWFKGLSIVDISVPDTPRVLFNAPGPDNIWREVREYKGYAYVTNEGDSGIQIINLNYLPDSIQTKWIRPMGITKSHTVFIDENGIAYINGPNSGVGGVIFLDLRTDPWNPTVMGNYNRYYVHDCFARGDTMYAAHINDGFFIIVDVRDKTATNNPVKTLAAQRTSLNFTHNTALSDDGRYLFTTDEKPNSFLDAYDISNLSSIKRTDRIQSNPGSNVIIHNTYYKNGWNITSYYRDGITIHDTHRPENLVQVGWFDSSPMAGDGFNGAWGVYPHFPSGSIIVSDIEEGLFVLSPNYVRACYLEGLVRDSISLAPINNAQVVIIGTGITDYSNLLGEYKTGYRDSGLYTVQVSKAGYIPKTITGVRLDHGLVTNLTIDLVSLQRFALSGYVSDTNTGTAIENAIVSATNSDGEIFTATTNASGIYNIANVYSSRYDVFAGQWGHVTKAVNDTFYPSHQVQDFSLHKGYYDDFSLDFSWTTAATASSGSWQRAEPVGTTFPGTGATANPGADITDDLGKLCYTTGNGGGAAGDDDIDNGSVTLTSPNFDLSTYHAPKLSLYWWWFNAGGSGTPNDSLKLYLDNGITTKLIRTYTRLDRQSNWNYLDLLISDHMPPTATMKFILKAEDSTPGHLVEAGLDKFYVYDSLPDAPNTVSDISSKTDWIVYPNPSNDEFRIVFNSALENHDVWDLNIYDALGRVIEHRTVNENRVITLGHNYESGCYLAVLSANGKEVGRTKLIKTR